LAPWLERRHREGLSWRGLAELSGIPIWRLTYAERKLRAADSRFVEVAVRDHATSSSSRPAPFEVVLESGVRVRVDAEFDAAALRRLLAALSSSC
jgi:hypothetical protein